MTRRTTPDCDAIERRIRQCRIYGISYPRSLGVLLHSEAAMLATIARGSARYGAVEATIDDMVAVCGLGRNTLLKAIKALEDLDAIVIERRPQKRGAEAVPDLYRLSPALARVLLA